MAEPKYGTPAWDKYIEDERSALENTVGPVWDTKEVQEDFEVLSFLAPSIDVIRKEDGMHGTMLFQHSPRFYYLFTPSKY